MRKISPDSTARFVNGKNGKMENTRTRRWTTSYRRQACVGGKNAETHSHNLTTLVIIAIVESKLSIASKVGQGRSSVALVLSTSTPKATNAIISCVKRARHHQGRRKEETFSSRSSHRVRTIKHPGDTIQKNRQRNGGKSSSGPYRGHGPHVSQKYPLASTTSSESACSLSFVHRRSPIFEKHKDREGELRMSLERISA